MPEKILIIEDNAQDAKAAQEALRKAGYADIVTASTAAEGLALAEEKQPTVVILDTILPDKDGFKVCEELRPFKAHDMWIIMTTGAIQTADALKAREAGADDFVIKTIECDGLLGALKDIAQQREHARRFDVVVQSLGNGAIIKQMTKEIIKKTYPGAAELEDGSLMYAYLTATRNSYVKLLFQDGLLVDWDIHNGEM